MKKFYVLCVLAMFVSQLSLFAQNPTFNRGGRAGGQQPTGHLYGKVVDASNKGVEAASVTIVANRTDSATNTPKEVVIGGMLTDKGGNFSIENVPAFGRYQFKVTGIGFKTVQRPVSFDLPNTGQARSNDPSAFAGALDKDLGNIKVEADEQVLGNVTVTASRPALTLGIDRKIFNVDRNITSAGGTAVDVMKNVPSVNVDIDGNVTLRNTAPTIFVDGRPTTMTLEQIPADAIESIEIITNPSAKFDASGGTAGILNIVMKKNRRVGYSGNVRANVDSRGRIGFGGDANIRQNKINVFAGGVFNQRKSISTGLTTRLTQREDSSYYSTQRDRSVGLGQFGFARLGFDYFMDNRNTITVTGHLGGGSMSPQSANNILIDSFVNTILLSKERQLRLSNSENIFRNKGVQLSFKHNFPQSGHELTADVTYNKGRNENKGDIVTDYYTLPGEVFRNRYLQNTLGLGNNENVTIQSDYAKPLSANSKVEIGVRANMRKVVSQNTVTVAGEDNTTFYNSNDNVYAAYGTFSNRIKNFGYQLGLRAESSDFDALLPLKGQTFKTSYLISLFPSLFLSQKIGENDDLQLNYSRRINRPNFWQLFPFTDYSDSLNISRGNPALQPEFTNSIELSYSKVFKNRDNLLASVYFKNTNNLITRIQAQEYDTIFQKVIPINTFQNANRSYITGLELTSRNKVTKFWDVTANANFFTAKIDLDSIADPDQFISYFFKLNNTFRLPKNFSIQLSGDYQSKIISSPSSGGFGGRGGGFFGGSQSAAQGYIRPNYGVDAAIRFEFLKNRAASLSLNVNDVFRTKLFDQHTETSFFVQDAQRRRDPQVFRLNFNYRFGKMDINLFKRKNNKAESDIDIGNANQ